MVVLEAGFCQQQCFNGLYLDLLRGRAREVGSRREGKRSLVRTELWASCGESWLKLVDRQQYHQQFDLGISQDDRCVVLDK